MKNYTNHISEDLLVKYMLDETTETESIEVENWLAQDKANEHYYGQFKLIWEHSKKLENRSAVDENAAWERFQQRIEKKESKVVRMTSFYNQWLKIASVVLLIAGGGWLVYRHSEQNVSQQLATVTAKENILSDTLSDGSVVTLNRLASISYSKKFSGNARVVKLQGEAFFNVTPDKNKPFIIEAGDVTIKVVGTSFNVKTSAEGTEVIVETGIVEVTKDHNTVTLLPHEKAVTQKNSQEPLKQNNKDELYNYYRTKEFTCNSTPLYRLVEVLNEAYGAHIVIGNKDITNLPLTTTFHNEPLDKILTVVSESFDIQIEKHGEEIILR